jgi:hypothetical protein
MEFHNTIGMEGEALSNAIKGAKTQEERILFIFKMQGVAMSPDEVHTLYTQLFNDAPITSIRRAMSSMSNGIRGHHSFSNEWVWVEAPKLEKTDQMVMGRYGKKNYRWKLKN